VKLLVEKLESTLTQSFTITGERKNVAAICPYIYMHGAPSGTFTLTVKQGSTTMTSGTFTSAAIKTALGTANNYAHVFYPIEVIAQFDAGEYDFILSASGYTATASSFIGWIRQHENLNNETDYTPDSDSDNPYAVRMKVYRK